MGTKRITLNIRETSTLKFALRKAIYDTIKEQETGEGIARFVGKDMLDYDIETWSKIQEKINDAYEIELIIIPKRNDEQ